jgi:hypothetical protein
MLKGGRYMSPVGEVVERARKMLDEGDPAGAIKVLQDAIEAMEAQVSYDLMARWTLLDEQAICYQALGDQDALKRVRAEQTRVVMQIDSKKATGEIRTQHIVTNRKKDLPSKERPAPPDTEESRRG